MKFQLPTGMHDLFAKDLEYFDKIEKVCKSIADFYGYQRIETPILEETKLFEKGTGILTDIVEKQMFTLRTRGGDHLALRPEGTPGIVRAYIQGGMQNLPKPVKLWYFGPFFRYERPQAGRYRQFYQFGFENIGAGSPAIDAELILVFYDILKKLGFHSLVVKINSVGDAQCRSHYREVLTKFLRSRRNLLCSNCQKKITKNPLRVLDCKEKKCQEATEDAPQFVDYLCKECHSHFRKLLEFLEELKIPYILDSRLVRGLDYYTRTVFEFFEAAKENKAQSALVGGGRYDNLIKSLGGKETFACGGAAGVDRIVNSLTLKSKPKVENGNPSVFLAQIGELAKRKSLMLFEKFREAKIKTEKAFHKDSLSSQLNLADKLGVKYTLILGQKEALKNEIIVREMKTGKQKTVSLKKIIKEMKNKV